VALTTLAMLLIVFIPVTLAVLAIVEGEAATADR
jgi:hypothetical protein